jgi:hypothetical protein
MASSLSDKAIFIYDTFFSANITQGQLETQIKQSSLFRLAFEEVISYPNLLDQMKSHDRYDEIIGINTEAYNMIFLNETREENSQLEVSTYLKITDPDLTQSEFDDFLNTVSGHIGFGAIINNPKTAYDIAGNIGAVDLITNNDNAIKALLNAPNGLTAFGRDPVASSRIFSNDQIYKQLRQATRFNQYDVLPNTLSDTGYEIIKVGKKYFSVLDNISKAFVSDDMYSWTEFTAPDGANFNNHPFGNAVAYDKISGNYFFLTRANGAPYYTKDFINWSRVSGSFGATYPRSIVSWNNGIYFTAYNASNAWDTFRIELGSTIGSSVKKGDWQQNYVYLPQPDRDDHPYLVQFDGGHSFSFIDKNNNINFRSKTTAAGGMGGVMNLQDSFTDTYRGTRSITYANGYLFHTFYYSQSGDTRIGIDKVTLDEVSFSYNGNNLSVINKRVFYWYVYGSTQYTRVLYKNGVYMQSVPGGYATSLNGVVWDKILFDVTYDFQLTGSDERGFIGFVPGTNFVLTSYDAEQSVIQEATTTTTTAAPAGNNLPLGLTELECLVDNTSTAVVQYNGYKMIFNNKDYYENTNYVVTNGDYKILNVPEDYPIAVLNRGKEQKITYTGNIAKKHFCTTTGTDADGVYDFFYGDVTIKVKGNFQSVSLYYYKKPGFTGYLGMEKILVHQDYLTNVGSTAADTGLRVSDTSKYSSSVRNFNCIGNESLEQTDLVKVLYTTTTTTQVPSYTEIIPPTTTTTTQPPNYGDENYSTVTSLSSGTEHAIDIDASNLITINGVTFDSAASSGNRHTLGTGTYIFNVAEDKPVAFEGATNSPFFGPQHSRISYSGDFYKRSVKSINGIPYYFYHGQVILIVDEPFVTLNLVAFDSGTAVATNAFSWDRSTTTTTTASPTTTTTTDAQTTYTRCIKPSPVITAIDGRYIFDSVSYETNTKIGLNTGTYVFTNVPQSHPIAILNYGKWNHISYTGAPLKSVTHTAEDGREYAYYYGDVTVTVSGDFGIISYDCSNHGYMGGENRLIFSSNCPVALQPEAPTTTSTTTTTTAIPNSILRVTTTTTTTAAPTTTTTTTSAPTEAEHCLVSGSSGNIVTFSGGNYVFNGNSGLYGMTAGTYIFKNVSASHPIAFLNYGKTSAVTYSGQYSAGSKEGSDGYQYAYYYGDVTVTVTGDFNFLSYECFYHGYMGGENNIIFDNTNCT